MRAKDLARQLLLSLDLNSWKTFRQLAANSAHSKHHKAKSDLILKSPYENPIKSSFDNLGDEENSFFLEIEVLSVLGDHEENI
ncbi:MAG: hypothetical protein K0R02_101 [Rickettsiaceae bacterium]|jgi:hypothetical protein|nr:hypothetical protein [Rickettsiaceae bacterium]